MNETVQRATERTRTNAEKMGKRLGEFAVDGAYPSSGCDRWRNSAASRADRGCASTSSSPPSPDADV